MISIGQIRKWVVLATESREVMLISEECNPAELRFDCLCLTADGTDVRLTIERTGGEDSAQPWVIVNSAGESWQAGEVPDALLHAIGEALGDKESTT